MSGRVRSLVPGLHLVVVHRCFIKIGVLKNFAKFTRNTFPNFTKKETQVFSCEFCEIFKNTFFYKTLPVAALP